MNLIVSDKDVERAMNAFMQKGRPVHIDDLVILFIKHWAETQYTKTDSNTVEALHSALLEQNYFSLKKQLSEHLESNLINYVGYGDCWLNRAFLPRVLNENASLVNPQTIFECLCSDPNKSEQSIDELCVSCLVFTSSRKMLILQRFLLGAVLSQTPELFELTDGNKWRPNEVAQETARQKAAQKVAKEAFAKQQALLRKAARKASKNASQKKQVKADEHLTPLQRKRAKAQSTRLAGATQPVQLNQSKQADANDIKTSVFARLMGCSFTTRSQTKKQFLPDQYGAVKRVGDFNTKPQNGKKKK